MLPYILLIGISFSAYFLCVKKNMRKRVLYIGYSGQNKEYNLSLDCFFLLLAILIACRAETVGTDTANYHYIFEKSTRYSNILIILQQGEECLFVLLNYILYHISPNYHFYLATIALIEILPLRYIYCQDRRHALAKIALFVNMSTFVMLFSGIRQAMAISLGVLAFDCLKRRKKSLFAVLTVTAFFIHTSGFMIAFLYPLYHIKLKKEHFVVIAPVIAVIYIANRQLFSIAVGILSRFSDKFNAQIMSTGAVGSLLLFALLAVFVYLVGDERQMDDEAFGLRNILFFAVLIQCFAPLHTLAMRMNYYYIIFIPLAVGKCLSTPRKKYKEIAKWGEIIIVVFFTIYYFCGLYMSHISGEGLLNTVPYIPFWAE